MKKVTSRLGLVGEAACSRDESASEAGNETTSFGGGQALEARERKVLEALEDDPKRERE
ncbi:hypothetical protein AXF42_Ash015282 [Apostasia shenzhenica]|uniref:Uncharacterized protein n=1 Tax=Apostasia shenzhenica TaxID=1088818 RepID=A0A2I0ALT1_9ASPA|nr:hypothetical protein AXF42_Ash015282 [Apostasia shenzhenica]